ALPRDDEALDARVACAARALARVQARRIEHALGLVAVAPLLVGEGVHGEVEEPVELEVVPGELAGGRDRAERRRRRKVAGTFCGKVPATFQQRAARPYRWKPTTKPSSCH